MKSKLKERIRNMFSNVTDLRNHLEANIGNLSRSLVNNNLDDILSLISTYQESQRILNGKYTHTTDLVFDPLSTLDSKFENNIVVTEYKGPLGIGYRVILRAKQGVNIFKKIVDEGPENRSIDWKRDFEDYEANG